MLKITTPFGPTKSFLGGTKLSGAPKVFPDIKQLSRALNVAILHLMWVNNPYMDPMGMGLRCCYGMEVTKLASNPISLLGSFFFEQFKIIAAPQNRICRLFLFTPAINPPNEQDIESERLPPF